MHFSEAEQIAIGALHRCTKCGIAKSPAEFYARKQSPSGLESRCKECKKVESKKYRAEHLEAARAYDRQRNSLPHRVAALNEIDRNRRNRPERVAAYKAARLKEQALHPEKFRARDAVNNAVRAGILLPWPACAIPDCDERPEAHHPDYGAPLDVVWLCPCHHREVHKMAKRLNRNLPYKKD